MNTVKVVNNTLSVWNIGPLDVGGECYTLVPGQPKVIPTEFFLKFDRNVILERAFAEGKLALVADSAPPATVDPSLSELLARPGAPASPAQQSLSDVVSTPPPAEPAAPAAPVITPEQLSSLLKR
jgi:hypothetical protein